MASWERTTEMPWQRSTETSLGVSLETCLRGHWDGQKDVAMMLSRRPLAGLGGSILGPLLLLVYIDDFSTGLSSNRRLLA